jgi:C4-dicarboxylate transporter DctQ subunit
MLKKIEAVVVKLNQLICISTIFTMFLLVFVNDIGLYFFKYTFLWVDELARWLMISTAFMGMGLAIRNRQHVSIEIVQDHVPERVRTAIRIVVAAIVIVFASIFAYLGYQYSVGMRGILSPAMRFPVSFVYLIIPIGYALFIFNYLFVVKHYIFEKRGAALEAEIKEQMALYGQSSTEGEAE